MRIKATFFLILLVSSSFVSAPKRSAILERDYLVVLQRVIVDKDFQSYFKSRKLNLFPVLLKYGNNAYVLTNPAASFKEISLDSLAGKPVLMLQSLKILEEDKIRFKINFLDRKLLITAVRLGPVCEPNSWAVRSLLGRKAGGIKPELYTLK